MKEILFTQVMQGQTVKGVLRIVYTKIFFKYNESNYSKQVIDEYRKKGVKVTLSDKKDWIMVEPFEGHELIKLRDNEINVKESSVEEVEDFLLEFYKTEYKRLGYFIETI